MSEKPLNSRREFLQKMIALTALAGVAPYAGSLAPGGASSAVNGNPLINHQHFVGRGRVLIQFQRREDARGARSDNNHIVCFQH